MDITFDDPTNVTAMPAALCAVVSGFLGLSCDSGNGFVVDNAPNQALGQFGDSYMFRQFLTPGVYPFHSVRTGATGRVIVTTNVRGTD